MDMHATFGTDETFEREGIWYEFDKETKFLLARAGGANVPFAKRLEAVTRPYRRQIENETIDLEFANGLLRQAWCETVLKGWKGFIYKGKKVPYSLENSLKYMEMLPDLYLELRGESQRIAHFRTAAIEDDSGN